MLETKEKHYRIHNILEKGIVAHVPFRIHLVYLLYARSTLSVNPKKEKDNRTIETTDIEKTLLGLIIDYGIIWYILEGLDFCN